MPHPIMSSIRTKLASNEVVLLDGGTGTELEKRGVDVNDKLWSGIAILKHPQTLQDLHLEYLQAGAEIIITASYQLSKQAILERGLDPDEIYSKSVELCYNAQQIHLNTTGKKTYVAASIGPYGAMLCDGSEFTGDYRNASDEQIREFHKARLEFMFKSPKVDMIAFETIPKLQEIRVLTEMIKELNSNTNNPKDYYFSSTCNDEYQLADGGNWDDVLHYLNENADNHLIAIGANCCKLLNTDNIISNINKALIKSSNLLKNNLKIIIYPNSGEVYDGFSKTWSIDPQLKTQDLQFEMHKMAEKWLTCPRVGIIGGCCRTSSEDTKVLRKLIDEHEQKN